MQAAETTS